MSYKRQNENIKGALPFQSRVRIALLYGVIDLL